MTDPRTPRRNRLTAALFAAAALAVASCTVLPDNTPLPQLFVLSPKSSFSPDLPRVDWQLTVDKPVAEAGLNTARIALRQSPVTLEYFARANWIDTAPTMVQRLLVESFENTGKIVAVGRQSVALRSDYSLIPELREFQAEYDGKPVPTIRVRLNVKLVKMPQRDIIATTTVEHLVEAKDANLVSVVHAFDDALGKTLKRLVEWTLTTAPPRTDRR